MAGLPGTGLGGIFYILLVSWMLLRELWRRARGKPVVRENWRAIRFLGAIAVAILAGLWIEGLMLQGWLTRQSAGPGAKAFALDALVPALAVSPFLVLALMIGVIRVSAWLTPPSGAAHGPPDTGPKP